MASTSEDEELSAEERLFLLQQALQERLAECTSDSQKMDLVCEYLDSEEVATQQRIDDFGPELEWLNTSRRLSLWGDLAGKVVVLDFFTYCCINCMHVLPTLHALEEAFPPSRGLAVVGVHSAKFDNERVLANVANAVLRYGIRHPVVNDPLGLLWTRLRITCWPTLLVLGPGSRPLFRVVGEGDADAVRLFCRAALHRWAAHLDCSPLPTRLLKDCTDPSGLLFPGKVSVGGTRVAVSDTGHHRLLVLTRHGVVQEVIGTGEPGFEDGDFGRCRFRCPQGVVWVGHDALFVADTENHAIRKVDLVTRVVSTVAGTGRQGCDLDGGCLGTQQELNSPWDLCLGPADGGERDVVYVAMAGCHQIWAYLLSDALLLGRPLPKGTCVRVAGSGTEENRNNLYPKKAGFSQPSGITLGLLAEKGQQVPALFVADSESSTVRAISLRTGSVVGIAGGDRDPKNLFSFGDEDGVQTKAKLQHPLGVAWDAQEQKVYIADSYNHKIKVVDPVSKECRTVAGGRGSSWGEVQFDEPGGLCTSGRLLLVADTNNHAIKVLDLERHTAEQMPVIFVSADEVDHVLREEVVLPGETRITLPRTAVSHRIGIFMGLSMADGLCMTEDAPHRFQLYLPSCVVMSTQHASSPLTGRFCLSSQPAWFLEVHQQQDEVDIVVAVTVFVCQKDSGCCFSRKIVFGVPLVWKDGRGEDQSVKLTHTISR